MAATDEKILNGKGLEQLWSLVKAETAKGAKIATGSYVGTGTYGASNPCSLTFDFEPKFVWVCGKSRSYNDYKFCFISGMTEVCYIGGQYVTINVSWSEKTISWYGTSDIGQLNESGRELLYFAIG